MKKRITAVALGLAFIAAACGSGGTRNDSSGATTAAAPTEAPATTASAPVGSTATTAAPEAPTTEAAKDPCAGVTLEATEVGITADTITLMAMADTGSPLAPGLAQGAIDAMKGWADAVNASGGLACRKVAVETYDSKLDANETRNGYTKGCETAFAMVGTYSLFVADTSEMVNCKDKAGAQTGLPETPAFIQSPIQACNPSTFSAWNLGEPCPLQTGVRELTAVTATGKYLKSVLGDDAHGVYILANTTPTLIESAMANFRYMQRDLGLVADVEGGAGSRDTQDHFTPYATVAKEKGSTFVYSLPAINNFLGMYREAKAQGVDTVKVWLCSPVCYDPAFLSAGGSEVEGVQSFIYTLPYEEASENAAMQEFMAHVQTHNNFAMNAWVNAQLFRTAVDAVVGEKGPNGLTRAALLDALAKVEDFDAGGLIGPTTPSKRIPTSCVIIVGVHNGAYERVYPTEAGTFSCTEPGKISIDPSTEYKG